MRSPDATQTAVHAAGLVPAAFSLDFRHLEQAAKLDSAGGLC